MVISCVQVLRMLLSNDELVSLDVVAIQLVSDTSCQCGCRVVASDCDNRTHRYDTESCTCRCLDQSAATSCVAPRHWDPLRCLCACSAVLRCHDDELFNHTSCAYVNKRLFWTLLHIRVGFIAAARCIAIRRLCWLVGSFVRSLTFILLGRMSRKRLEIEARFQWTTKCSVGRLLISHYCCCLYWPM